MKITPSAENVCYGDEVSHSCEVEVRGDDGIREVGAIRCYAERASARVASPAHYPAFR